MLQAIGIDTHKATLAACAVAELGRPVAERTFANDRAGHAALRDRARAVAPGTRIGVEGSGGFGAAAARSLLAAGEDAVEVPAQPSHRERSRARRAGKSDPGDALAIARVTLREPALPPVRTAGPTRELQLPVEAREDAVAEATRVRNRVHADLLVLAPGHAAAAANLVALRRRRAVGRLPRGQADVHAGLARDRLARLGRLMAEARALETRIGDLVQGHPLLSLPGAGALTTARLIGEAGDMRRFRSADAFAMLAGVAPIPASSGQTSRMRLNRAGNRQLNRTLHTIALTQAWHHPPARAFVARRRAEGKTWREAIRALKQHLARVVFRLLATGSPTRA